MYFLGCLSFLAADLAPAYPAPINKSLGKTAAPIIPAFASLDALFHFLANAICGSLAFF